MTLIKSISGIRGTIGGKPGDNLTPVDVVECTAAFGVWIKSRHDNPKVVVGRDGRITGEIVSNLAVNTLLSMGIDVVDLGLSTTPTVEIAVPKENASAGIIFTASHNPKQWNALKFLNSKGEFISAEDGAELLQYVTDGKLEFTDVDSLGKLEKRDDYIDIHIDDILALDLVKTDLVKSKKFKVVVDCINSTGAISVPPLLDKLGCEYILLNEEITGDFAHNPEPKPEHLQDLCAAVKSHGAAFGISIDPDVDRLAFVMENGECFGEEFTLVAMAEYILSIKGGNTVSNLSSTRALADVTAKYNGSYTAAAVGEVNVVNAMKASNAVIGGEGNGGVILPELHYGRDALVGIAMMLSLLAKDEITMSQLKAKFPDYKIVKDKIQLTPETDIEAILSALKEIYKDERTNTVDGLKIDFENEWVHLRKSNTEPIIRVYAEAEDDAVARALVDKIKSQALSV